MKKTQDAASAADQRQWPRQRTAQSKGDRRNEQIYEAAARLFYEKGYASTSLQDLADSVGLQKGSLYHYISSKEDLLFSITEHSHTFFMELVVNQALEGTPSERLEELLYRHAKFAADHFLLTAVFYNERSALSPEHRSHVIATRDSYEALLRELIEAGQQAGEFAQDIDVKIGTLGILGMINWIHHWYHPDGSVDSEQIARMLARMAIRSLCHDG